MRVPVLVTAPTLLVACQGPLETGQATLPAAQQVVQWIGLPAEPWAVLAEPGGPWVVLNDHTLARYDPAANRLLGPHPGRL